jgi:hypothetical protein
VTYVERHCAFNRRFVAWFLVVPNAMLVLLLLLGFLSHLWAVAAPLLGIVGYLALITWTMVYRNWPTSIRVDGEGVRIGAAASHRTRRVSAVHQAWGLFDCPWEAVLGISVVADADGLDRIRHAGALMAPTNRWGKPRNSMLRKGVLTAPFMRAALVVQVDPGRATVPATSASRFYDNRSTVRQYRDAGVESAIWIVPTRRPVELRRAVQHSPAFRSVPPALPEAPRPPRYHL